MRSAKVYVDIRLFLILVIFSFLEITEQMEGVHYEAEYGCEEETQPITKAG